MSKIGYLGIDIGSISTNLVLIDSDKNEFSKNYIRGVGSPIHSVQKGLLMIRDEIREDITIKGVCSTGSGRVLIGMMVGSDIIKNEISAHAKGAIHSHPDVKTIFEIGGQDSKVTIIRDSAVVDFSMNLVCAAGTGSFLDSQARRLGITVQEMSELSILSDNPTTIAGRCTVFAESDMIHKQQVGHKQKDIVMGLCKALVRNYLSNVCRGKSLKPPFILQGGVSANKGIVKAFESELKHKVIIPEHHMVMGAFGAALLAAETNIEKTSFRGFNISNHNISTSTFICNDCANCCEIIEIIDSVKIIGRSGGRCRKWEGTSGAKEQIKKSPSHSNLRKLPEKLQITVNPNQLSNNNPMERPISHSF